MSIARKHSSAPLLPDARLLDKLALSCLTADDGAALMMGMADPKELAAEGFPAKAALELPYIKAHGKPSGFKRWRYLESTLNGFDKLTERKDLRYVQPKNSVQEVYMPPLEDWAAIQKNTEETIVITEGELKAACCTRLSYPCLGLGGVYSFKSAKRHMPLLPIFYDFEWVKRKVIVAYDSDANTNPMVVAARNELCAELLALGAEPRIANLTPGADGMRRGIDDIALQEGAEALQALLDASEESTASSALHELNQEVAYVRDPGLVVVLLDGRKMRASDFISHAYANRHFTIYSLSPEGKPKPTLKKAAQAWVEWPHRHELAALVYSPGQAQITKAQEYNTWPGWGCEPKRGGVAPWRTLLGHLFGSNDEDCSWFERWCALPLQVPGAKMYTAAVLWGVRTGTGKSLIGSTLSKIYGKNYTLIGDAQLQDSRNEWAQNRQFVMGDDVTGHDQRKYADRLKAMITQETMRIDPKYIPSFSIRDCINYLFTSNHPDAFFLEDDDRRNFVHECSAAPMPPEFYRDYVLWLADGGAQALFYHLLHLDLKGMHAEDRAPDTASRRSMISDGLSDLGAWVRRLRDDPDIVLKIGDAKLQGDLWTASDLLWLYDPEAKGKATANGLGRELKRSGLRQVYNGMPLPTHAGHARLFAIRNIEKWHAIKAGPVLAAHYAETRGPFDPKRNAQKIKAKRKALKAKAEPVAEKSKHPIPEEKTKPEKPNGKQSAPAPFEIGGFVPGKKF